MGVGGGGREGEGKVVGEEGVSAGLVWSGKGPWVGYI